MNHPEFATIEASRWDEVRRAQLRAELDAYYACLYGLTRDELRHILNLKELYKQPLHLARRRFPDGR